MSGLLVLEAQDKHTQQDGCAIDLFEERKHANKHRVEVSAIVFEGRTEIIVWVMCMLDLVQPVNLRKQRTRSKE